MLRQEVAAELVVTEGSTEDGVSGKEENGGNANDRRERNERASQRRVVGTTVEV